MPPKHEVAGSSPARPTTFGWSKFGLTYYDEKTRTCYMGLQAMIAHWVLAGIRPEIEMARREWRRDLDAAREQLRSSQRALAQAQHQIYEARVELEACRGLSARPAGE